MNSSAIWEIIALSHAFEGNVIVRGEARAKPSTIYHSNEYNYFPKLYSDSCDYLLNT